MDRTSNEFISIGEPSTNDPFLVIFPYDINLESDIKEIKKYSTHFINNYLSAANIVLSYLEEKGYHASKDNLIIPLLNIYVNCLEFAMKLFIEQILRHNDSCEFSQHANSPNNKPSQRNTHKLSTLFTDVKSINPKQNCFHSFNNLDRLENIVNSFEQSSITSESTRYLTSSKGKLLPLHTEQRFVYIKKIHQEVSYISQSIINHITSDEIYLCSSGEFSESKLQELQSNLNLMIKVEPVFLDWIEQNKAFENQRASPDKKPPFGTEGFRSGDDYIKESIRSRRSLNGNKIYSCLKKRSSS